jgi:hypothetical protein
VEQFLDLINHGCSEYHPHMENSLPPKSRTSVCCSWNKSPQKGSENWLSVGEYRLYISRGFFMPSGTDGDADYQPDYHSFSHFHRRQVVFRQETYYLDSCRMAGIYKFAGKGWNVLVSIKLNP